MESDTTTSQKASPRNPDARDQFANVRVWPMVVFLAAFWAFLYWNYTAELAMLTRFMSRMVAYVILLLVFLGWWLTRRAIRYRTRLAAVVTVVLLLIMAGLLSHHTVDGFALVLFSVPVVFTVWTLWLLLARRSSATFQRAGFLLAMIVIIGFFDTVRSQGVDAMQRPELRWRWTPTDEQLFLTSHAAEANQPPGSVDAALKPWSLKPSDCPDYRGAGRDGVVTGCALDPDWKTHPPQLIWRQKIGPAWSGLIVVDGHIITQEQRDEAEVVSCYDAATGKELWVHKDEVRFEESLSGAGPRGTPTFADGRIYSLGAKGLLNCLQAETGNTIWWRDCPADAEMTTSEIPQWGYSVSPLVVDGRVIVFAGGSKGKSTLAYQANDGKIAWTSASGRQSYSSPQLATLHGVKQILMQDNRALAGINITDGAVLWQFPSKSEMSLPMLQPHVAENDNLVVSTEPGVAMLAIKQAEGKWNAEIAWAHNKLRAGFNDFVLHNGCLYGLDDGVLCCIDMTDGKRLWKKGRLGHGQLLVLADQDLLLISTDKGEVILVSANRIGYEELGRFQAIEGKTWNSPVLIGRRLYLRNGEEMAAYDLPVKGGTN
jgi:outer membrane protein assembly factor BamB